MELLVELLIGIAWPAATIWIAYLFSGEVRGLLTRLSHLKCKELKAKFEKELAEAEAEAKKVEQQRKIALPSPEHLSQLDQLRRIADVSPRAAIMEAWVLIETSAFSAGFASGTTRPIVNPYSVVKHLAESGKISEESINLMHKLRKLRNQAAQLPDFALTQEEAERYLELAAKIAELISRANGSTS